MKGKVWHCQDATAPPAPNPVNFGTQLMFIVYDSSNVERARKTYSVLPPAPTWAGSYTAQGGAANAVPFDVTVNTLTGDAGALFSSGWTYGFDGILNPGDYVTVRLRAKGQDGIVGPTYTLEYGITADSKVEVWPDASMYVGNTVSLRQVLPKKVKQKEFLLDIIRMFNLYLQPQKSNPRVIDIEPRDEFYDLSDAVDWTPKADLSKPVVITPLGDLAAKTFLYTYKSDGDAINKAYSEEYKEVYGQHREEVFNDFVKGERKIELTASATPITGPRIYHGNPNDPDDSRWDRYFSSIVKTAPSVDGVPGGSFSGNYRILYWAPRSTMMPQGWWGNARTGPAEADMYVYGYAGHLDHVYGPKYDLNFGYPREVYYSYTTWTDNNLFNAYHREELLDRSSQKSRVITANFRLTPADVAGLDFRKAYVFDGHLCRLNKVQDYQAINSEESTLVELVTVAEARTRFVPTASVGTGVGGGTTGSYGTGVLTPIGDDVYERSVILPATSGGERGQVAETKTKALKVGVGTKSTDIVVARIRVTKTGLSTADIEILSGAGTVNDLSVPSSVGVHFVYYFDTPLASDNVVAFLSIDSEGSSLNNIYYPVCYYRTKEVVYIYVGRDSSWSSDTVHVSMMCYAVN